MQYKRIYEFLVWDNCNNNCQFCWQREKPRLYNHNMRSSILNDVIEWIKINIENEKEEEDFKKLQKAYDLLLEVKSSYGGYNDTN